MSINLKPEPSFKAWIYRTLLGPAMIIDGVFALITIGSVNLGLALYIARGLAMTRFLTGTYKWAK